MQLTENAATPPDHHPGFSRRLWLILVLSLALRALVVGVVLPDVERAASGTDAEQFLILGYNLAAHGAFSQAEEPPYLPDPIRTPGYPAAIALLTWLAGPRPLAAILIAQAVVGALTAAGVALLARRLVGPEAGWQAGLFAALAPATLILIGFASAEVFFSAWLVGGALLLVEGLRRERWSLSGLGGLCFGAAALTRPIGVMLLPVLVIVPLVDRPLRRAWRPALASVAGLALLAGLWMGRNGALFGRFSMSAISDINLYYYNAASLEARRLGISIDEARTRLEAQLEAMPPSDSAWPTANMGALAREVILDHPLAFAVTNGIDALNGLRPGFSYMLLLFGDPGSIRDPIQTFRNGDIAGAVRALPGESIPILMLEVYLIAATGMLVVLAVVGCAALIARRQWAAACLAGLLPAILLYLPGLASNARFRAPAEPFLALLAGAGTAALARTRRGRGGTPPGSRS